MKNYLDEKIINNNFLRILNNNFKNTDYTLFEFYPVDNVTDVDLNNLIQTFKSNVLAEFNQHENSKYEIIRSHSLIDRNVDSYQLKFELKNKEYLIDSEIDSKNISLIKIFFKNSHGQVSFGINEVSYTELFAEKEIELHYTLSKESNSVGVKSILSDDNIEFKFLKDSKKIIYSHIQVEDYTTRNYADDYQDIDYDNNPEEHDDFQENFYSFFKLSKFINNKSSENLYPILLDLFFEKSTLSEENIDLVKILHDIDLSDLKKSLTFENKKLRPLKI